MGNWEEQYIFSTNKKQEKGEKKILMGQGVLVSRQRKL
jgi:hypothetical protein